MIELLASCGALAVPLPVMAAVVQVESGGNRYAIGVVGGELERQPNNLREAVATAGMLEKQGYNYSLGAAQINKKNFAAYGITSPEQAFDYCTSVRTGARILAECQQRAQGDWGKAFSCYYSGNFATGFKDGYVQKVAAAWQGIPLQQRTPDAEGAVLLNAGLCRGSRRLRSRAWYLIRSRRRFWAICESSIRWPPRSRKRCR